MVKVWPDTVAAEGLYKWPLAPSQEDVEHDEDAIHCGTGRELAIAKTGVNALGRKSPCRLGGQTFERNWCPR